MEIITVINQKGGVGKTTTAIAIGAGLKKRGHSVLFVDLDPQGNMSSTLRADLRGPNILGALQDPSSINDQIQKTECGDILASSDKLAAADKILDETGKEYRLKEALGKLKTKYDYVIVDTPPSLSVLTINALTACNGGAIIPSAADIYSIQGIAQLKGTTDTVRKYCNPELYIRGIVITQFNPRLTLRRDLSTIIEKTAKTVGTKVFRAKIRQNISISEAATKRMSIYDYAPNSHGAEDYNAIVDELLEGGK